MLTLELCWNGDHFKVGTVAAPVAGAQVISFQRKHPLCSWFASMLVCFAGGIIANLLLGEPIIAPFKDHRALITASIIWYVVKLKLPFPPPQGLTILAKNFQTLIFDSLS